MLKPYICCFILFMKYANIAYMALISLHQSTNFLITPRTQHSNKLREFKTSGYVSLQGKNVDQTKKHKVEMVCITINFSKIF